MKAHAVKVLIGTFRARQLFANASTALQTPRRTAGICCEVARLFTPARVPRRRMHHAGCPRLAKISLCTLRLDISSRRPDSRSQSKLHVISGHSGASKLRCFRVIASNPEFDKVQHSVRVRAHRMLTWRCVQMGAGVAVDGLAHFCSTSFDENKAKVRASGQLLRVSSADAGPQH